MAVTIVFLLCLLCLAGCQSEADLDVVLVKDCNEDAPFSTIKSFRVYLLHDAGWNDQIELLGCIKSKKCFTSPEHFTAPLSDFEQIRQVAAKADVVFHTTPGSNQAIVLAGFTEENCTPPREDPQLPICGFHVSAVPAEDATFHLLVGCSGAPKICWGAEFMDSCDLD